MSVYIYKKTEAGIAQDKICATRLAAHKKDGWVTSLSSLEETEVNDETETEDSNETELEDDLEPEVETETEPEYEVELEGEAELEDESELEDEPEASAEWEDLASKVRHLGGRPRKSWTIDHLKEKIAELEINV